MSTSGPSLTSTLILALTQSEALQRRLEDSNKTIEGLKRENEKLKQQLQDVQQQYRQPQNNDQPDLAAQLEHSFQKNAEKQAEIDSLKKRLRNRSRTNTPNVSSPQTNSARKHARSNSTEGGPLRETSGNSSPGRRPFQRLRFSDGGAEAIAFVAEDGDDHTVDGRSDVSKNSANTNSSPNRRLQSLLKGPAPTIAALPRPNHAKKTPISKRTPEDDEPLRSRPVHRLNLSHFKVNPKYTSGLDFVFHDVVRGKEERKCLPSCTKECCSRIFRALAETLPPERDLSEDALLLEFLGPGSEQRILGLTPLARTNLVHEARGKRLSNMFGRMHRTNFERPSTPPDFWTVDMPSTQEHVESREQARQAEREEVENRYQDVMNRGRWLFADET